LDSLEFSINEITYSTLLKKKRKAGFEDKSWDEWFKNLFGIKHKSQQEKMENAANKFFYDKNFDQWVKNFAINLNDIWKDNSAKILEPNQNDAQNENSAIVLGAGPAIKKFKHLEILSKSQYNGSIICTDKILANALKAGVTPDKFPKFYVTTIDTFDDIWTLYDDDIIQEYGDKINGIFSTLTDPQAIAQARQNKIKIHWVHPLFDYNEGQKSFNHISALMTRSKNQSKGLPAIQTGGNVGTSCWFIGWQILKCSTICLIGINHGWEEEDPIELILAHGTNHKMPTIDTDSTLFKKLFPKIYNPEFKTYCILDPVYQYYSNALKEFISRSPKWLNTINSTESGSIFGDRITCSKFTEFLSKYEC
jgi:hypothetical protein